MDVTSSEWGTDLYTEGNHVAPLLWHFNASYSRLSDTALVGAISASALSLLTEIQVGDRYKVV